jgi:predicted ATPase/class 3 adenylate cyclase
MSTAARSIPSGTVTFYFTDIEGSTVRWERDRAAMQAAVRRHDRLMHDAIAAHGGHVFKTVGDAFCAAFARPGDAVAAALAAQRALATEDFSAVDGVRVRMALHTGTADERDDDYFGPTVNRVARLLAVGHGGQVLVSGTTSGLLRDELPAAASLRDLGEHRLKDLAQPERVYQLLATDLRAEFPPLRSLDVLANNLPAATTSFVGREREIAEIATLLERHRVVTLTGAGGIGKTRTSLQVAAGLIDGFPGGVWLVELAPLSSGEYLPSTIAQVLDISLGSDGEPLQQLVRALESKRALLVFDNCEHLVDASAHVVAALLRGCPGIRVLASSRQPLGIAGEAAYRLPSLDVAGEAVTLFVERARAADARFVMSDEMQPAVAEICRRLDGIPLAIELAAARVRMLAPQQILARLDERFRVLTGGGRDVLPRQQTLRALIDWSYDLLDERERALFRRLGVFVSGFELEGGAAAANGAGLDEADAFDVLASIVDKSLVQAEPGGATTRYRLLESTRAYANEKLESAGELADASRIHLHYLRDRFCAGASEALLELELDDLRSALDWAIESGDIVTGAELLAAIDRTWVSVGLEREGLARLEAFVARLGENAPSLRALLWSASAALALNSGRTGRALEAATQAVAAARAGDDGAALAEALGVYAIAGARSGRLDDAALALEEAERFRDASTVLRLRLLETRSNLSLLRGDLEAAAHANERLRQEHRKLGNGLPELTAALNLAEVEHARGRSHRAIELSREVVAELRARSDRTLLANVLANVAGYLAAVNELDEACAAACEAIREHATRDPGDAYVAMAIEHLALALALSGDLSRAATLAGYSDDALRRHGFEREFTETTTRDRLTAVLSERLDAAALERLSATGSGLAPEDAVALALVP